jgi:lipoprotein-anchoring transpeptidase ErfK/SrfK
MLAKVQVPAPRYASPGHREPGMVPATWYERPSVLPVLAIRPGWVKVLAQRPAGKAAWIPAGDVRLASTPYRIVINVTRTRLTLYDMGHTVFSAPVGVGAPSDPTPTGHYFAAFFEQSVGPGYGPFVIVTSARSQAITDWEGSGDAAIGIHGPLGAEQAIAAGGARISHGCIRLELSALHRLRNIPPGTPIDIIPR